MASLKWIDEQFSFVTGRMGIYKLASGEQFLFEPTADFYELLSGGDCSKLNQAIRILADHIECSTCPVVERWNRSESPLVTSAHDWTADQAPAGTIFRAGHGQANIQLNIAFKYSPYVLGAILTHELSHHFLSLRRISYPDDLETEKLTDLATVYIGLGKLTLNGYDLRTWSTQRGTYSNYFSDQVGYLSIVDLAAALYRLCTLRALSTEMASVNLIGDAKFAFAKAGNRHKDYELKKQLVGERECLHCGRYALFGFHNDDAEIYCEKCGWEWNHILKECARKTNQLTNPFSSVQKMLKALKQRIQGDPPNENKIQG